MGQRTEMRPLGRPTFLTARLSCCYRGHRGFDPALSSLLQDFLLPKVPFVPELPNLAPTLKTDLLITLPPSMLLYSRHLILGTTKLSAFTSPTEIISIQV